jgi:hypothetical protein
LKGWNVVFIILIFLITSVFTFSVRADDSKDILYAAELNRLVLGTRAAAMGAGGVALPFDATAMVWNPASSSFATSGEVAAEYASLYGGMSSIACGAFRTPLQQKTSVGLLYEPFLSGKIDRWDSLPGTYLERQMNPSMRANGSNVGTFTNTQHLLMLALSKIFQLPVPRPSSYSYPLPIELAVGVGFKGYWQTMNPKGKLRMGMNFNCDVGMLLHIGIDYDISKNMTNREFYAGLSIKDVLGTKVIWLHSPTNYEEKVDKDEYVGFSYVDKTGILWANWTVTLAGEWFYRKTVHFGIEAQFWNLISFRAGISDKIPTLGAGVLYKKISLDYAFSFDDLAYSPLRLSLGYTF